MRQRSDESCRLIPRKKNTTFFCISACHESLHSKVEDEEILSAVECHTTLKKNAGTYDQVLFISDKISWDQEGHPPYYDVLKRMAAESPDEACRFYILYQLDHGLLLMPHRWILEACEDLQHRAGKSPEVQCPTSILSCRKDVLL